MSLLTPSHKRNIQNIIKKEKMLEIDKFNENKINQNFEEESRFKTISHLKIYNNLDQDNLNKVSLKLFEEKEKRNFLNNTESNINNKKNEKEKIIYKLKNKSTPKNRNNITSERNNENKIIKKNILSESYNNMEKLKGKNKIENILIKNNNINLNQRQNEEESVNLSELAEDLLSLSEGYNAEIMRKGPINKKDFLGESKEIYNINKSKRNNLINMNQNNIINLDPSKTMPKLQTKIYSSPLDKLNLKKDNYYNIKKRNKKNNNNVKNNFYNFQLDDINTSNIMQTQIQSVEARTFASKINNHISSSSMKNNGNNSKNKYDNKNIKNNNKEIDNIILNNLISSSQTVKNNNLNNRNNMDNIFNKTALNQYNKNDFIDFETENLNNMNNNHSVGKEKINRHLNVNYNNSNRNFKKNQNIKNINSIKSKNTLKSNNEFFINDYSKINYNKENQILIDQRNNKKVNNNIKNMNNMNNLNNSNYIQNFNSINNLSNYYINNNYKINNNNISKYPIQSQILKKTQTFIGNSQNNQKQINNIEYFNKNVKNINMIKNKVLNNNTNYIKNYDNGENKLNYSSKLQNKIKNYQSNKLLRKSDFHKHSNKNVLSNIGALDKNTINDYENPKHANKNSYKNIYNYMNINLNINEAEVNNENIYINDKDLIYKHKQLNNLNSKNLTNGDKKRNFYIYQGQNNNIDYFSKNNYLNNGLELKVY